MFKKEIIEEVKYIRHTRLILKSGNEVEFTTTFSTKEKAEASCTEILFFLLDKDNEDQLRLYANIAIRSSQVDYFINYIREESTPKPE